MGSVKDLVMDGLVGRLYFPPTTREFGQGAWEVSGRFSVGDLKQLIPDANIKDKAEALTMSTGAFFEWLAVVHPEFPTCYLGVVDKDGMITTVNEMLGKGDKTHHIVMKLAHVPESYYQGDLETYRNALASGVLECGVADVESIFRHGFPLGSSAFEKIFKAVYGEEEGKLYNALATYNETTRALDILREVVSEDRAEGVDLSGLDKLLRSSHLDQIPNPGYVLRDIVYNSTSKFEIAGDRDLTPEEERRFSGLSDSGYELWTQSMFPALARAQIQFCKERGINNMDGKAEVVAYKGRPVITDFACTVDENRLMLDVEVDGETWAIPSNKEIQRAIFRQAGVYSAIGEAKWRAIKSEADDWREYIPQILQDRKIDLKAVTEQSVNLMGYAIGEVANRMLEQRVFDVKPVESWAPAFLPYASKIEYQEAA